jgi:hypothetical protein
MTLGNSICVSGNPRVSAPEVLEANRADLSDLVVCVIETWPSQSWMALVSIGQGIAAGARSMCGWTLNSKPAPTPARSTMRGTRHGERRTAFGCECTEADSVASSPTAAERYGQGMYRRRYGGCPPLHFGGRSARLCTVGLIDNPGGVSPGASHSQRRSGGIEQSEL